MAIQVEIWRQDIVENLFPANQFSAYAVNHDPHVVEGAIVHIPRAGARPTVVKNRPTVPAAVSTRTDTDVQYTLAEYSTDPVYLKNATRYELSYDLRMSVLGEHLLALRETVHDELLHTWLGNVTGLGDLPVNNMLLTTGEEQGDGTRALALADVLALKRTMDKANLPYEGRYLLLPPELYAQLFTLPQLINNEILGRTTLPEGVVARVLGFEVLQRSYTPSYTAAGALKPKAAAPATGDRLSAVAWSRYSVSRALGEVALYENVNDPTYYGDVYSASVRAGGTRLRNSGVYALLQGNA